MVKRSNLLDTMYMGDATLYVDTMPTDGQQVEDVSFIINEMVRV